LKRQTNTIRLNYTSDLDSKIIKIFVDETLQNGWMINKEIYDNGQAYKYYIQLCKDIHDPLSAFFNVNLIILCTENSSQYEWFSEL
jgi:hypothetical protein